MSATQQRVEQCTITASDGTPLVVDVMGTGRALVIVPGSVSTAANWHRVANALTDSFTVHIMNRRGHGPSPDGAHYSFDQEVDDVATVLQTAGPEAALFGHSFGGALVLAHASTAPPAALIAYDPGIRVDKLIGGDSIALVTEALDRDPEEGLLMGMRTFGRFPEEAITQARQTSDWDQMVAMAATWPREIQGLDELDVSPERFARITSPTLLLRGGQSPAWLRETAARLANTIPHAQLLDLPGKGHEANTTAPRMIADRLRKFLNDQ